MSSFDLILASASPRRLELLAGIGISARALPVDLDESALAGESPLEQVQRLARHKAQAGWHCRDAALPVLGGDTALSLEGELIGKPRDTDHALALLRRLSGRAHQVISAVAVIGPAGLEEALVVSEVRFRPLGEEEIAAYVASGEGADKAGGYALQGLGAIFVERIEGSWSAIVGLPLCETAQLLARQGVAPWRDGERLRKSVFSS
ncbi:Maf family protein [Kushneria aurantia]|uniref:dTTP/UTP pyrophosphatase n=1 Tax=Kushneria aurantia TaxID=504092 RepID=A0ABV6G3R1_9GAMM|nr:Maf family protein [Kushneria aurantia]